jgi:predicted PurR-regulated permease PerM
MFYILSLILTLGFIFSAISGTNFMGSLWDQITQRVGGFTFPKTQKEITIDNLESQYSELDKFFSSSVPLLLNSDSISSQDKESLKRAEQIFKESQNTIKQIKDIDKNGKSITKTIVEKVFNFNPEKEGKSAVKAFVEKIFNLDAKPSPELTSIPPNCNL